MVQAGAQAIAAGKQHSMVLKKDGSVWATGYNAYGQLGTGSATNSDIFVEVISDGVKIIAAGAFHSMALKHDGSVWATGSNQYGQFGDGTTSSKHSYGRLTPVEHGVSLPFAHYSCSISQPQCTQQLA